MEGIPLISESYKPTNSLFAIRRPKIPSGAKYYFNNENGLVYQVSFGKKKNNYFGNLINFSVISDDYEDEYSETNKGEVWKIISTIIEVIRIYHEYHPHSRSYEFSGEFKKGEIQIGSSIRTRMFLRALMKVIDFKFWKVSLEENKVILLRKKND